MSKNLDKIKDILQKGEDITKGDYEQIHKLYVRLPLEELDYDVVIYGVIERLYNAKLIDFEPTELAFDPI